MTDPANDPRDVRHPRCPQCGYNLRALYEASNPRYLKCPECGRESFSTDLSWTRDHEISLRYRGIVRMSCHVIARSVIGLVALGLLILAHNYRIGQYGVARYTTYNRWYIFAYGASGIALGFFIAWRLSAIAAYETRLLPIIATVEFLVLLAAMWLLLSTIITVSHIAVEPAMVIAGICTIASVFVKYGNDHRWWRRRSDD